MAKKVFKGRVICKGTYEGEAIVSHQGLNTLATFQKSALKNAKQIIGSDQNNPDVYGLVIQTISQMGINPAALLFSEEIDSLAASGVILAKNWENSKIIAIDKLGKDILKTIKSGDKISISEDGTVTLLD